MDILTRNIILLLLVSFAHNTAAQPVPAGDENIPYLMTFGNRAETSWGDDDFSLTFFFRIPKEYTDPVYIRIWDPDCGGNHDEVNGVFDTQTTFEIFGGEDCWEPDDAKGINPVGNYKSGNLLAFKSFGNDSRYDDSWYTFGPFNPTEGEFVDQWQEYVFKIIVEGVEGDDGNMYRFYLTTDPEKNRDVEGGNAFAYEYSFRMHNNPNEVSHIYPFVDDRGDRSVQFLVKTTGAKMNLPCWKGRPQNHWTCNSTRKNPLPCVTIMWLLQYKTNMVSICPFS
jgi:hypothetical protein